MITRKAWLATAQVMAGGVTGTAGCAVAVALVIVGVALWWTVVAPLLAALSLLLLVRIWTPLQRSRLRAFTGTDPAEGTASRSRRGPFGTLRWRQVGYHFAAGPAGLPGALALLVLWSAGLLLATALIHGWTLPADGPFG